MYITVNVSYAAALLYIIGFILTVRPIYLGFREDLEKISDKIEVYGKFTLGVLVSVAWPIIACAAALVGVKIFLIDGEWPS